MSGFLAGLRDKVVKFRVSAKANLEVEGTFLSVEEFGIGRDFQYFLKIRQKDRGVYINMAHLVSIEEKEQ